MTQRVVTPSGDLNSASRFVETTKSAPKKTQITNHPVGDSEIIVEPAIALIKKLDESHNISSTGWCLTNIE